MDLISPGTPGTPYVTLSKTVPPDFECNKVAHAEPFFGSTAKGGYLIQKLSPHVQLSQHHYQAWFIDLVAKAKHTINIIEESAPSFCIAVQIHNTLDCKVNDLPRIDNLEWSMNLLYFKTMFAELHLQPEKKYSTFILLVPENDVRDLAKNSSDLEEFYLKHAGKERSERLYTKNVVCTFEVLESIKAFRDSVQELQAYRELTKSCFDVLTKKNRQLKNIVHDKELQKVYSLEQYVIEHITDKHLLELLCVKFDLSYDRLKKICHTVYNLSPAKWLRYHKFSAIQRDLRKGMPLKAIAEKYGYDYNSLLRAYQNFFGVHANPHHLKNQV